MDSELETTISIQLTKAIEHHIAGRLQIAKPLYQKILEISPNHPIALNQLGTIALQTRNFTDAVKLISKAIKQKPDYAEAYNNLATTLLEQNQIEEAIQNYRKAIDVKPNYVNAYNNLADALINQGKLGQAKECYNKALAINYEYFQGHNNLGNLLMKLGQSSEAIACYRRAISIKSDYFEAHNNLGNALAEFSSPTLAIASFKKALEINPNYVDASLNLGSLLLTIGQIKESIVFINRALTLNPDHAQANFLMGKILKVEGKFEDSLYFYSKALSLRPSYPEAMNNMGNVLLELMRIDDAVAIFSKLLRIKPDFVEAHSNLGNALKYQKKTTEAINSYKQAIHLDPNFAEAYCNLGVLYKELGDLNKATSLFYDAIKINPNYSEAHHNLGLAHLLKGNFKKGWKGYSNRWKFGPLAKYRRTYNTSAWKGQKLKDKVLFIYPEQGLGDFIQFIRYLPILKKNGCHVITETPEPLFNLVSRSFKDFLIIKPNNTLPDFDFHVPLLDLPELMNTTRSSIPAPEHYLEASKELKQKWSKLSSYKDLKVGLIWAGDPKHKNDHNRTIDPSLFSPILNLKDIMVFSLQVGHSGEAKQVLGEKIIDLEPEINSFDDTAAIMKNLDIIVSIDSSPAHLAGALGCKVWILLPLMPDWRWMLDGKTTPWYPSMSLFRQTEIGNWKNVIQKICHELRTTRSSN